MSDLLDFSPPGQLANDSLAGARARFYDAGTSTPRTVYSDSALTTPHPSPLEADADGLFAQAFVAGGAVKVVVTDAVEGSLYTLDPCSKIAASGAAASAVSFAPTPEIVATNVQAAIEEVQEAVADGYRLSDITILTSGTAATYTTPSGARALRVLLHGGGGGGGGVDGQGAGTAAYGGGGSSGGWVQLWITSPEASYTYTIGAGGTGGAAGVNNGGDGGDTTWDGSSNSASATGGGGGDGKIASASGAGSSGSASANSVSGFTVYTEGRGNESAITRWVSGNVVSYANNAPSSIFGGQVWRGSSGADGANGPAYGSGGVGGQVTDATSNYAGGDGADGVIIVEVFF